MTSGLSVISASTPQPRSRVASASESTVHTWTLRLARCASCTNAGAPQRGRLDTSHRPPEAGRSIQRPIVMYDDEAVAGETDVELDPVGAERESVLERGERILGPQRGAAAMGEDQRPRRTEERV